MTSRDLRAELLAHALMAVLAVVVAYRIYTFVESGARRRVVSERTFHVEWGGTADMTPGEIWPNGDAPDDPTVDDVIAQMRKEGSLSALARWWNFNLQGVEVNGKDSGLR